MRLAKFTASTQKLKKEGLYQLGARKNKLVRVQRFANCSAVFYDLGPIIIPENLLYFFSKDEIQAMIDKKIKIKNGKVA